MQVMGGPDPGQDKNEARQAAEAADMDAFVWLLAYHRPQLPLLFKLLIGINVAVFLAMLPFGAGLIEANSDVHMAWGANFGAAIAGGQYWRLLTAAFLHFGLLHLVFNMMALYSLGALTERLFGRWPFLVLYLGAAITGSLASVYFKPDGAISAGASGAIFGLGGALAAFWLRNGRVVPLSVLRGQWINLALFIGFSVFMGVTATGIDNAAHAGGFFGGAVLGLLLTTPLHQAGTAGPARLGLGLVTIALILLTVLPLLPEPAYRYPAEKPAADAIVEVLREDARLGDVARKLDQERTGLSEEVFRQRLETDLLLPWRNAARSLNDLTVRPDSRLAERLEALRAYVNLRVRFYEHYVAGLRGDRARLREAEAVASQLKPAADAVRRSLEAR